jgi:hypothetical protein
MSNISRKFKRKNIAKNKKQVKKLLKTQASVLDKFAGKCIFCDAVFDRNNSEHLDLFRVHIEGNDVKLCCNNCWDNNLI